MVKLNIDTVEDYEEDLTYFNDYVPLRLYPYINITMRNKYLEKKGLKKKIDTIIQKKKIELHKTSNPFKFLHDDFIKWVHNNQEFKELLIE